VQAYEAEVGINRAPAPLDPGAPSQGGASQEHDIANALLRAVLHTSAVEKAAADAKIAANNQEIAQLRALLQVRMRCSVAWPGFRTRPARPQCYGMHACLCPA
jgi:hypothetical protein